MTQDMPRTKAANRTYGSVKHLPAANQQKFQAFHDLTLANRYNQESVCVKKNLNASLSSLPIFF